MKRTLYPLIGLICLAFGASAQVREVPAITVLADASLTLPLTKIAIQYSRNVKVAVATAYGSAGQHLKDIEEGEPSDILITLDRTAIEHLKTKGMVDVNSPVTVAPNTLVFVRSGVGAMSNIALPKEMTPEWFKELGVKEPAFQVSIVNPETSPEGASAKRVLETLFGSDPTAHIQLHESEVEVIDTLNRRGGYAVILGTTARQLPAQATTAPIPQTLYPPLDYTAVVVAGENMAEARRFVQYLISPEVQVLFEQAGFAARAKEID